MLQKQHRLKTTRDFDRVYKNGKSIKTAYFNFIYLKVSNIGRTKNGAKLPCFGFVASKKVGGAVKRNRAKRLLREAVRTELPNLKPEFEAIIIAYNSIVDLQITELLPIVQKVFKNADLY